MSHVCNPNSRGFYRIIYKYRFFLWSLIYPLLILPSLPHAWARLPKVRPLGDRESYLREGTPPSLYAGILISHPLHLQLFCQMTSFLTEVARTRLREEGSRHSGFINCLINVYREDGYRGLYRGLGTHLIRQIPNTAIVLATYEGCVYLYTRYNESSVETN